MFDVVVIGGGPAGVTAALRARELGASVALVEGERMGGTCTNDGCAPTRVLAKAARLVRDAQQFDLYGLDACRPEVDFERLMGRVQSVIYTIHEKKQLSGYLEKAGVTTLVGVGDAAFENTNTLVLPDGTRLEAGKFIIAVGGHSRQISFPGSELAISHHDIWSLKKLPRSITLVGGAATGCQVASIMEAFGAKVNLLEMSPRLLAREDPLISRSLTDVFTRRGINIITSIGGVERIERAGGDSVAGGKSLAGDGGTRALTLHYKVGDEVQTLTSEAIMLSVGWVGNLEALNLDAAGVKTERGYVVVNDFFQTSAPNIFAAGDITGRMMLVQSGSYEGRMAAENAVLGVGAPYKHKIIPHGGFTEPEYGSVGITEDQICQQEGACVVAVVPYANMDRAVIDNATEGYCKLIVSQENHRVLGAHVVGEQAVEIVQLVATAMAADMWVEQLAEVELAYPTYTAIVGLAARRVVHSLGVMPVAPQWRALGEPFSPAEWERSGL